MIRSAGILSFLLATFISCFTLYAQAAEVGGAQDGKPETARVPSLEESDELIIIRDEEAITAPSVYNPGDQTFGVDLGLTFPLFFISPDGSALANKIKLGGCGMLSYDYYLTENFALGGEFGGMFAPTVGGNMLYIMPFGLRATWQFINGSFEFPLSLLIGTASQSYLTSNYFGLFVKPAVSAYWRFNPDWSFGAAAAWWWVPQWAEDNKSSYGNILQITLGTRYHF